MNKKSYTGLFAIFAGLIIIMACNNRRTLSGSEWTLRTTDFKPALFTDDHVSEGFLAPIDDGRIMLIFRLDPGVKGSLVGNDGLYS